MQALSEDFQHVWQNTHTNTVKCVMVCNVYFPFPKILQLYERVYAQRYSIYKKSKKNVTFLLLNCSNIYNL